MAKRHVGFLRKDVINLEFIIYYIIQTAAARCEASTSSSTPEELEAVQRKAEEDVAQELQAWGENELKKKLQARKFKRVRCAHWLILARISQSLLKCCLRAD